MLVAPEFHEQPQETGFDRKQHEKARQIYKYHANLQNLTLSFSPNDHTPNLQSRTTFIHITKMTSTLKIAIVGAGPAGLTLGLLLQKRAIPFTLFEMRSKPTKEELDEPAGSLDLHRDTGLKALRDLGLYEQFQTLIDDCSEEMMIADKDGNILFQSMDDEEGHEPRPEISRNKLAHLLISQFKESNIRWQHKLTSAARVSPNDETSQIELDFGPNGKHRFDLVLGSDGAWSKIRSILTDVKPTFADQHNITLNIQNIHTKHPELAKLVGGGSFMALGYRHGVCSQRATKDTARIYNFISSTDEHYATTHDIKSKTPSEMKDFLFEGENAPLRRFGPVIKQLVCAACDDETARNPNGLVDIRPMYTLYSESSEFRWGHQRGATLLGDAAHLMPPNGEGVNRGMEDALFLAEAIQLGSSQSKESNDGKHILEAIDDEIKKYEEAMRERTKGVAAETNELLTVMYRSGDNGGEIMTKWFKEMMAAAMAAQAAGEPRKE